MHALFNPDSKFMRGMSRVGDLLLLNLFFLITSLPIFTIGASVTAMYTVCFRFGTDREQGTTKSFFIAFKENFKQSTILWIGIVVLMLATAFCVVFFKLTAGWMHYLWILFAFMFFLAFAIGLFVFPLQSQFENKVRQTFKNAMILSIGYLPRTVLMGIFVAFPLILLYKDIYIFLHCGFIFLTLYFSSITYLSSLLLKKVFKPYMEASEEPTQEELEETV